MKTILRNASGLQAALLATGPALSLGAVAPRPGRGERRLPGPAQRERDLHLQLRHPASGMVPDTEPAAAAPSRNWTMAFPVADRPLRPADGRPATARPFIIRG
jgi:hypothetical protein